MIKSSILDNWESGTTELCFTNILCIAALNLRDQAAKTTHIVCEHSTTIYHQIGAKRKAQH